MDKIIIISLGFIYLISIFPCYSNVFSNENKFFRSELLTKSQKKELVIEISKTIKQTNHDVKKFHIKMINEMFDRQKNKDQDSLKLSNKIELANNKYLPLYFFIDNRIVSILRLENEKGLFVFSLDGVNLQTDEFYYTTGFIGKTLSEENDTSIFTSFLINNAYAESYIKNAFKRGWRNLKKGVGKVGNMIYKYGIDQIDLNLTGEREKNNSDNFYLILLINAGIFGLEMAGIPINAAIKLTSFLALGISGVIHLTKRPLIKAIGEAMKNINEWCQTELEKFNKYHEDIMDNLYHITLKQNHDGHYCSDSDKQVKQQLFSKFNQKVINVIPFLKDDQKKLINKQAMCHLGEGGKFVWSPKFEKIKKPLEKLNIDFDKVDKNFSLYKLLFSKVKEKGESLNRHMLFGQRREFNRNYREAVTCMEKLEKLVKRFIYNDNKIEN